MYSSEAANAYVSLSLMFYTYTWLLSWPINGPPYPVQWWEVAEANSTVRKIVLRWPRNGPPFHVTWWEVAESYANAESNPTADQLTVLHSMLTG